MLKQIENKQTKELTSISKGRRNEGCLDNYVVENDSENEDD